MKFVFLFIALVASTAAFAADTSTKSILDKIANDADIGNGSASVKTYTVASFDLDAALAHGLKVAKHKWGAGCAPYVTTTYRRDSINAMKKFTNDTATADALESLYRDGKIAKIYSILTNSNVECSQMWVEVYTIDGYLLDLWYGNGD